jgi:hypothetical protein
MSGVRWTPRAEYEREVIPRLAERARLLRSGIKEIRSGDARQRSLRQLWERVRISSDEPLRNEALLGLSRVQYWAAKRSRDAGEIGRLHELFRLAVRAPSQDSTLQQLLAASCAEFLESPLCKQARPVSWQAPVPDAPAAPAWAAAQRRLRSRIEKITSWWVEQRQLPTGELGGGWRNDAALVRQWGPMAAGLGSPIAAKGLERFANGLWASGELQYGYDKLLGPAEESSRLAASVEPWLAAISPRDAKTLERLAETAACAQYWIGKQQDGRYRFSSSRFNCRETDERPEHAIDRHENLLAMGPALWHAYLTRHSNTLSLIWHWADSWAASMRIADSLPPGFIPPAVRSSDGSPAPGAEWSGESQEALTSLFLAVHELTGDPRWLDIAAESFASVNKEFRKAPEAFLEWRAKTGIEKFDAPMGRRRPDGMDAALLDQMALEAKKAEERIAHNFGLLTSEVLFTDQLDYALPGEYQRFLFGNQPPRGDRYPFFGVTWQPGPEEYARAVLGASEDSLRLQFFNFEAQPVTAQFWAWRLAPGKYSWRNQQTGERGEFAVAERPHRIAIPLPPGQEAAIEIRKR